MPVCLSVGGQTTFRSAAPTSEVLVATQDGIVELRRSGVGADWHETTRFLEGKHISALLVEPSEGMLFAGTHQHGLYASRDGGQSWERRDNGIASQNVYILSSSGQGDGLTLYAGTQPAHLYRSKDLGETWQEIEALRSVPSVPNWTFPSPPHESHLKHLSFDPSAPQTIYASVEVGGLFKSVDGGQSWRELGGFDEDVHRVMVVPTQPRQLHMANGKGYYQSRDAGETWQHVARALADVVAYPDGFVVHPDRASLLFAAGATSSPGEWRSLGVTASSLVRSRDGGATWEPLTLTGGSSEPMTGNIEALTIDVWPNGFGLLAGTTTGLVFFSADEGETWSTIASGLPSIVKGRNARPAHAVLAA